MRFLRGRLALLALGLLLMQVATVAVSGWLACCDREAQAAATPMDCCKEGVGKPGQMCPMHRGEEAKDRDATRRCAMRSDCSPDRTFLQVLFFDAGVSSQTSDFQLQLASAQPVASTGDPIGRAVVPEPPPPRF
jgi:hypothetical protein